MEINKLIEILSDMRSDSLRLCLNPSEEHFKEITDKYDLVLVGGKFEVVYTDDLSRTLKNVYGFDIPLSELNDIIPLACKSLNMKFEPMVNAEDITNRKLFCHQVYLR